jgi:Domain of unknown function (DUF4037)
MTTRVPGWETSEPQAVASEAGMRDFVGGLDLSGLFYEKAVWPILDSTFPGLTHSAALIGYGSEVLDYDTPRSTDHEWGPRLLLFLSDGDHKVHAARVAEVLRYRLPRRFGGHSTHFGEPDAEGVRVPERRTSGPVEHKVEVHTVRRFFVSWTSLDPLGEIGLTDWLRVPQQRLLEVTAGRVYHDGLGELGKARAKLAYYPRDVWLYMLAAQWRRVGHLEAFVGRTGEVGDGLGWRLIAAGLTHDLMRLCFLMERRYAPYAKWFGTAFSRLRCATELRPHLEGALAADSWKQRESHLSRAYEAIARMHNELGVTLPLETMVTPFHGRPYLVLHAERFAAALEEAVTDPRVRSLPQGVGSADQLTDSTDVLAKPEIYSRLGTLYGDRSLSQHSIDSSGG